MATTLLDRLLTARNLLLCYLILPEWNMCSALQTPFLTPSLLPITRTSTADRFITISPIEQTQQELEVKARQAHRLGPFNALFVEVPELPAPHSCTVPPTDNPYHNFLLSATLPKDFPPGAFLRMGPNGAAPDEGYFDGDGFINCVIFPPQSDQVRDNQETHDTSFPFTATYVDTLGRQTERRAASINENNKNDQRPRYRGTLGGAPRGWPVLAALVQNAFTLRTRRALKDTCNTALALHGSTLIALMEQSLPTELRVRRDGRVETVCASSNLNGAIPEDDVVTGGNLGAHGRTCARTGERIHVSYSSSQKPYARVDIFGLQPQANDSSNQKNGEDTMTTTSPRGFHLKRSIPIHDLDVPVMIHDLALTENYVVVLDLPLTIRPGRMLRDQFPVAYEPEHGARIGLVPRHHSSDGTAPVIQWFTVDPCVVLHTVQAYETKDNKVILQGLRSVPKTSSSYITSYTTTFLHEWVMDLESGRAQEQCLNPNELVEFPVVDTRQNGKAADFAFAIHVSSIGGPITTLKTPREGILIDGLVKFALVDNTEKGLRKGEVVDRFVLPEHWYTVSEATLVPKVGNDMDSVYVVLVATHVPEGLRDLERVRNGKTLTSHVLVLDGDCLGAGPLWAAETPQHVPYGLHSEFIPWDSLHQ